jgi:hypothetical protein
MSSYNKELQKNNVKIKYGELISLLAKKIVMIFQVILMKLTRII